MAQHAARHHTPSHHLGQFPWVQGKRLVTPNADGLTYLNGFPKSTVDTGTQSPVLAGPSVMPSSAKTSHPGPASRFWHRNRCRQQGCSDSCSARRVSMAVVDPDSYLLSLKDPTLRAAILSRLKFTLV
jgi:hypothetical protein